MWPADELAQALGKELGRGSLLLAALPQQASSPGAAAVSAAPPPRLRLVLGDQLDPAGPQLAAFDSSRDCVVLIEAPGEASHVRSHKARIALLLSAMRHFAAELRSRGIAPIHVALDDPGFADAPGLIERLARAIEQLCLRVGISLTVLPDAHFLCSRRQFAEWARGRRELRLEHF